MRGSTPCLPGFWWISYYKSATTSDQNYNVLVFSLQSQKSGGTIITAIIKKTIMNPNNHGKQDLHWGAVAVFIGAKCWKRWWRCCWETLSFEYPVFLHKCIKQPSFHRSIHQIRTSQDILFFSGLQQQSCDMFRERFCHDKHLVQC